MTDPVLVRSNPEAHTLNTQTESTDGKTTLVFKLAGLATDLVEQKKAKVNGQVGPTVAARFYAAFGRSVYEAYQLFDDKLDSNLAPNIARKLEKLASGLGEKTSRIQRNDLIQNVIINTTATVLSALAPEGATSADETRAQLIKPLPNKLDAKVLALSDKLSSAILSELANDGSASTSSFAPVNASVENIKKIDHWVPEYNVAGKPESGIQKFLTPQWGSVDQLLGADKLTKLKSKIGKPEPFLLVDGDVDLDRKTITYNGVVHDINSSLVGSIINPEFINQAQRIVDISANLTPQQKLIAEFWEDGPGTGFPPGSWIEFGRYASELNNNSLADDAKMFLGIGEALLSASVASWGLKVETDYNRPLSVIRELSSLGLLRDEDPGRDGVQVYAYSRDSHKTELIDGTSWETYQSPGNFYSPPFSEYVSGHSTFSAAAGKVIDLITGSHRFGGSITTTSLFEKESQTPVTLSWKTWEDAWVESGASRLYGGIHFDDGNQNGTLLGVSIGTEVFKELSHLWS